MLSRRKMFGALTTGIGLSAVSADKAVALVFDDNDYLRERTERLAKHAAEMERQDAMYTAARDRVAKEDATIEPYLEASRHAHAFGEQCVHTMTYETYKLFNRRNLIDFIPDAEGKTILPTLMGQQVVVAA